MFADPKQTPLRRLRRQVKAGLSIVVALAAGTWLATRPGGADPGPSTSGPDARVGPRRSGSAPPPPPPPPPRDRDGATDGATDASLTVRDASIVRAPDAGRPARVDRREHRNGMPVRDNLLE